jgi:hypothetical protein
MPTWGEILQEINDTPSAQGGPDWDGVRRKYLTQLRALTGRNTVVYYTDWMSGLGGNAVSIVLEDMMGLMECYHGLQGKSVDLILHSPGGDATAAASLVAYTRKKFTDVRVIVPLAAMSAATMWALSADRILMGKHSQLGPIDPQLALQQGMVPADALRRQFETAKRECADDPRVLSVWLPTLQQYYPGLLELCSDAGKLAKRLVTNWLAEYMFAGRDDAAEKAAEVAAYFADDEGDHGLHSLGIDREAAKEQGLVIDALEADPALQDAVLSVHHATMHTLSGSPAVKIVENHLGRMFVKMAQQIQVVAPPGMTLPGAPGPVPPNAPPPEPPNAPPS